MKEVYSSPHDELPLKNDKCAASCTDLHLANRGITHLRGFEKFISLKTLWLNDNKLETINGLDENVQLNSLHLHCNRIKRLDKNSFTQFKFLSRLTLNNNLLDDFDGTLLELKCMRNLLSLDLQNNPIAEEDSYRLRVLAMIPSLKIFDLHRVTDEEREEVKKFKERMKRTNRYGLSASSSSSSSRSRIGSEGTTSTSTSTGTSTLVSVLSMLGAHAKEKRCSIEASFQEIDRRSLGVIEVACFWKVLRCYGLAQLLNDGEKEALVLCYKRPVKVRAISATGTLCKDYISYRKFCWDILPVALQGVKNVKAWKTDRAPEVSVATQALRNGIRTVKKQRLLEETEIKKQTMLLSDQNLLDDMKDPWHKKTQTHLGLDPWEGVELSRIISAAEATAVAATAGGPETNTPTLLNLPPNAASEAILLSREQCGDVLYQASTFKKIPFLGTQRTLDLLFDQLAEGGGIYSHKFRAAVGSPQCPLKPAEPPTPTRIVPPVVKGRKQEVLAESKVSSTGPPHQSGRQRDPDVDRLTMAPLVKWRDMTADEMRVLEDQISQQSTQLFRTLLRAGSSEDVRALSSQALQLGVIAARLGGQRVKETTPKLYYSPSEVTATATNRSDIIVLPNLKLSLSIKAGLSPSALSVPLSQSLSGTKLLKSAFRFQKSLCISVGGKQTQSASSCPETRTKGWAPGTSTLVLK